MTVRSLIFLGAGFVLAAGPAVLQGANKAVERADRAARVLSEVMESKDKAIPLDLLSKAHCVAIIPGMKKAGFGLGAKYGKGVISCRGKGGKGWTGPSTVKIEGGSIGFQIGGSSTDVVLLVMNERGKENCSAANSPSAPTLRSRAVLSAARRRCRPTRRCMPRFFPIPGREAFRGRLGGRRDAASRS